MKRLMLSLALTVFSVSAFAADDAADFHNWGVGIALGQAFPTGPDLFFQNEKKDLHGAAWVRYHVSNLLAFDLNYERLNFLTNGDQPDAAHLDGYTANVVLQSRLGRRWSQAYVAGVGFADVTNYGLRHQDVMAIARYGVSYDLTPAWALGAHAQFSYVGATSPRSPSEMHALSYLVSLAYTFGGSTVATAAVEHRPDPAPVAAAAPRDTDGDGVPDSLDKCPNTPAGMKVNAYGCQIHEAANVKLDLEFATGKAQVTESMKPMLLELAKFMSENPSTHVRIEGYTDTTGSPATNKRVSKARAAAIRQALIKDYSVSATRVSSAGLGPANPVASNDTASGREQNRRVMSVITQQ